MLKLLYLNKIQHKGSWFAKKKPNQAACILPTRPRRECRLGRHGHRQVSAMKYLHGGEHACRYNSFRTPEPAASPRSAGQPRQRTRQWQRRWGALSCKACEGGHEARLRSSPAPLPGRRSPHPAPHLAHAVVRPSGTSPGTLQLASGPVLSGDAYVQRETGSWQAPPPSHGTMANEAGSRGPRQVVQKCVHHTLTQPNPRDNREGSRHHVNAPPE